MWAEAGVEAGVEAIALDLRPAALGLLFWSANSTVVGIIAHRY
jgi:hypothetical protein